MSSSTTTTGKPFESALKQLCSIIEQLEKSIQIQPQQQQQQQQTKEKTLKAPKQPAAPVSKESESVQLFQQANLVVAKITSVSKHPSAETLYLLKVDVGGGQEKQVVAGLLKYYKPEEMQDRIVVAITNLKPAKLRGVESQAMLLAGDDTKTVPDQHNVKLLTPPASSVPGDRVYLKDHKPTVPPLDRVSPANWEKIVNLLAAKGGLATYDSMPFVTDKGDVTLDLPDGAGIH